VSVTDLQDSLRRLPPSASVPVGWVLDTLGACDVMVPATLMQEPEPASWRALLWTVPPETRLSSREAAEALGRSLSWVHKRTSEKYVEGHDVAPLPHRSLGGELAFMAGELRAWIKTHEQGDAA
jgi:hypothetical protein